MSEDEGQERTEDASSRRLDKAREEGRLPRSRELIAFSILFFTTLSCFSFGPRLVKTVKNILVYNFDLAPDIIFSSKSLSLHLFYSIKEVFFSMLPILISAVIACIAGSVVVGGWNMSTKVIAFDFSKMDPMRGLKRMFSLNALVELLKALFKFLVMTGFTILILYKKKEQVMNLASLSIQGSIVDAVSLIFYCLLYMILSLLLIVMLDVPFQIWHYKNELKMSKQDLKEEYKETEGKPEIKGKIRQAQRELAKRRMMEKVPKADVIITNPDHFSVALKYAKEDKAPKCIAKGVDLIAYSIKDVAKKHNIPIIEVPPLARALYYSTKLDAEIPIGLYKAVAQVLAYVYQLKEFKRGKGKKPLNVPKEVEIPPEYRRNP